MKPVIEIELLRALSNEELFHHVVRPIAVEMHSGKQSGHKLSVYKQLTAGQRAAFMFWVLHSHAPDPEQFYTWVAYMRNPSPGYWGELEDGIRFIENQAMSDFLHACDETYKRLKQDKPGWTAFRTADLNEPALKKEIGGLHGRLMELAPAVIDSLGEYLRLHDYQENDLLENLDKLHTTELGVLRIGRNLGLADSDPVAFCRNLILRAEKIELRGKNWYAYLGDIIVTVNAHSYTIITAHRTK